MRRDRGGLVVDLAAELETLMKAGGVKGYVKASEAPILGVCAEHSGRDQEPRQALEALVRSAIARIDAGQDREALTELFLAPTGDQSLAARGAKAAEHFDISYDALRRRNDQGVRRIDSLLEQLAANVNRVCPLDDLLGDAGYRGASLDPGPGAVSRAQVFLSYSHHDDAHEGGLVSSLRDALIREFRFQTGQDLRVLHDKSGIEFGEDWRRKIEDLLSQTSFLLVILTPSFLTSEQCRAELARFLQHERARDRDDLVLPIYYAPVDEDAEDHLVAALLARQYVDWRGLRFLDFGSPEIRMAVAKLATSVAAALGRRPEPVETPTDDVSPTELGTVEHFAKMQLALPRVIRGIATFTSEQEGVGNEFRQTTEQLNRLNQSGQGAASQLFVATQLRSRLEPYADRMEGISAGVREDLELIKGGIHAIAAELPDSQEAGLEETTLGMLDAIRESLGAMQDAEDSVEEFADVATGLGQKTSTLRPVLNRIVASARFVRTCKERFAQWLGILEQALDDWRRKAASVPPPEDESQR